MELSKINSILLRRKQRIIIAKEDLNLKPCCFSSVCSFNEELKALGYLLSAEVMVDMMKLRYDAFDSYRTTILDTIREMLGADVEHKPMYRNFPESVQNASDIKLLIDQLVGYSVDLYGVLNEAFHFEEGTVNLRERILFDGEKKERIKLSDNIEYRLINLETIDGFEKMFTALMKQNSSLSETDKKDLESFLTEYPDAVSYVPETIPFKETLAFVYALLMKMDIPYQKLPIKNASDFLRLAIALSGGDISLGTPPSFRRFKRKERTTLLNILNALESSRLIEDILRHKEEYKRLIEYLGLFTKRYTKKFPRLIEIFRDIYDHRKFDTFNKSYEEAFKKNDILSATDILKQRPGVFARYLDKLLRESEGNRMQREYILDCFEKLADKVETRLLWDLVYHFTYRNEDRIAFPKGEVSHAIAVEPQSKDLSRETIDRIIKICDQTLDRLYHKREEMSLVYVDEQLKNFTMPMAARSSSRTSEALSRGSRLKIRDGAQYLRMFVYWIGEDVDLSVTIMDKDFRYVDHVSYTNLRLGEEENTVHPIIHSGDITYAPEGASEFVDIDLRELSRLYPDACYIVENVFSYSEQSFNAIEKCFAGIMERDDPDKGEIFEPSTVRIKADITGAHRNSVPLILDLRNREIIWSDICGAFNYLESSIYQGNNVENNLASTALACKAFVNLKKANIHEVVMKNVLNRNGILVDRKKEDGGYFYYDRNGNKLNREDVTIFSVEEGITPKDMEILVSEYL